jgi:benzoate transport
MPSSHATREAPTPDSSHSIDPLGPDARWAPLSITVFLLCFLINGIDGANVMLMSYLAPLVAKDWNLGPQILGVVFSSLLCGMGFGGLLLAPLADRYGRRTLVLASLLLMSVGMICSGLSKTVFLFAISRFVVGVGFGAVIACMTALVAEFAPERNRSLAVGLLQAGYPIGAMISGFTTAWAITHFTWKFMFLSSGIGTFVFFLISLALLPESIGFLMRSQRASALAQINGIRQRLKALPLEKLPLAHTEIRSSNTIRALLSPELRRNTLLLWGAVFSGFMVLYTVISWIPKFAIDAGLNAQSGIIAGAFYNIGAFSGTAGLSILSKHFQLRQLISLFLASAAILLVIFGGISMPVAMVLFMAFAIGVSIQGGFNGLYPLATYVYPVEVRSSGIGSATGIGRVGAFLGPLMAGYLLSLHIASVLLFLALAVPAVIAAVCSFAVKPAGR